MKEIEVRESQIEDILVGAPILAKDILNLEQEPRLLSRQMIISSGRLDILYSHRTDLLLVELKTVPFRDQFIRQVSSYTEDLVALQKAGQIMQARVLSYLLVTQANHRQQESAALNKIRCIVYDPEKVLSYFYENFKPIALFTQTRPIDIGIWNIHLIHKVLYALERGVRTVTELRRDIGGSPRTLYNKIKFGAELKLLSWSPNQDPISLTALGIEYCLCKDYDMPLGLSENQAATLRSFVMRNPYESSVILGIASAVEAVFALSKNTYPVPMRNMMAYFTLHAGKYFDWQTEKAKYNATRMYTNYAADLGLIGKTQNHLYLTPEGIRFTIQMQLHKGLKLVGSMKII